MGYRPERAAEPKQTQCTSKQDARGPMLVHRWASIANSEPTLKIQHICQQIMCWAGVFHKHGLASQAM